MAEETNAELETFRKRWQEEVSARTKTSFSTKTFAKAADPPDSGAKTGISYPARVIPPQSNWRKHDDRVTGQHAHDLEEKEATQPSGVNVEGTHIDTQAHGKGSSALEYYERAVETESQGRLGESLKLYRQAYRVGHFP